jgi:hypothetical protein
MPLVAKLLGQLDLLQQWWRGAVMGTWSWADVHAAAELALPAVSMMCTHTVQHVESQRGNPGRCMQLGERLLACGDSSVAGH